MSLQMLFDVFYHSKDAQGLGTRWGLHGGDGKKTSILLSLDWEYNILFALL